MIFVIFIIFKIVNIQLLWHDFKARNDFGMCYIIFTKNGELNVSKKVEDANRKILLFMYEINKITIYQIQYGVFMTKDVFC